MRSQARWIVFPLLVVFAAGGLWLVNLGLRRHSSSAGRLLDAWQQGQVTGALTIVYPIDGTMFPPDLAPPTFWWVDSTPGVSNWWLVVQPAGSGKPVRLLLHKTVWKPDPATWRRLKLASRDRAATVTVLGVNPATPSRLLSGGRTSFLTSRDEVGAPVFYRDVPLPFLYAVRNTETIRWRLGYVSQTGSSAVVLENLPVCGNCHSFSRDGKTLGMDVNYANDKGSYAITPVEPKTILDRKRIITWNDYRREDGIKTYGLLSQVSPDGRYVVSTVKDRSVFVERDDLAYSQLFFPIRGILTVYDRQTREFKPLPGADDPQFVQSNPAWSPDGKYLVFARAPAEYLDKTKDKGEILLPQYLARDFLDGKRGFQFDLYRIPFNEGRGGTAIPIPGASRNRMSNYFPKVSPDGRWLVFTMAKNFMLLQPDSALYILPAEGGVPRKMNCNTTRMNSWHSWSPNGRWLVFSSKAFGPYTKLLLTHVDENGVDCPPVVLENLSPEFRAVNIPEFVNASPGALSSVVERFLDAYSFQRRGEEMSEDWGDPTNAVKYYSEALKRDPADPDARFKLGNAYLKLGEPEAAAREYTRSLGDGRSNLNAHLSSEPASSGPDDTLAAPRRWTNEANAHLNFSVALFQLGNLDAAARECREVLKLEPSRATAHLNLGMILDDSGDKQAAAEHYREALKCDPGNEPDCVDIARRLAGNSALSAEVGEFLARLVAVNPKSVQAHVLLGKVRVDQGRLAESLDSLRTAYGLDPAKPEWLKGKIAEIESRLKQGK